MVKAIADGLRQKLDQLETQVQELTDRVQELGTSQVIVVQNGELLPAATAPTQVAPDVPRCTYADKPNFPNCEVTASYFRCVFKVNTYVMRYLRFGLCSGKCSIWDRPEAQREALQRCVQQLLLVAEVREFGF